MTKTLLIILILIGVVSSAAWADYSSVVLADSPAAFWKLADTTVGTAADSSGNGHDGGYSGGVSLQQPGPFGCGDFSVLFDGIDGQANFVSAADLQYITTGEFTIEGWMKIQSGPSGIRTAMVSKSFKFGGAVSEWSFDVVDNAPVNAGVHAFNTVGADWLAAEGSTALSTGVWYYMVGTIKVSTTTAVTYLTAVSDATDITASGSPTAGGSSEIQIAVRNVCNGGCVQHYLNAWLAYIAIYDTVLTPTQITDHYNAGLAQIAACSARRRDWPFTASKEKTWQLGFLW